MQNKRRIPKPERKLPKTKEEFLIEWVLTRASFREDFSGTAAARVLKVLRARGHEVSVVLDAKTAKTVFEGVPVRRPSDQGFW